MSGQIRAVHILDFKRSSSSDFKLYFWTNIFSKMCIFLHITHLPFHCADLLALTLGLCRASWFPFWAQPALSKTDLNRYFYFLLFLLSINKIVLDMVYLLVFVYISSTQKSTERLMANSHVPIAQSCKCQLL